MQSTKSLHHTATQQTPDLRKTLRRETNQTIQAFESQQKTLVLLLRQVEQAIAWGECSLLVSVGGWV